MVRECNSISLFSVGCPHLRNFQSFCGMIGKPFGVSLPVPKIAGESGEARLAFVKEFCTGFLEHPREHLWHRYTCGLDKDSRLSIGMSLFLFRKVLPSSEPNLEAYALKMATASPDADAGFLAFVRKQVPKLFPSGWDLTMYPSACLSAVLPVKSCTQRGQGKGGARYEGLTRKVGWNDHQSYVLETLARESRVELQPSRLASVETGGKHRIVSTGDIECNLFRPLHTAIYNRLSSFPWLLRGKEKPSSFREFSQVPGELFVSGDYESATDNLNVHVSRLVLDLILKQSVAVPQGLKESAPQLLRTQLCLPKSDRVYIQERGQLMGNLLSFPILCLVNYLAFRYYSKTKGPDVPVRVNGDDIVFRAPVKNIESWKEGVIGSGLTLSIGKTMVDSRYFSLNSSLFKARGSRVSLIPFVRSTAFGYRVDCGGVETLHGRYRSFAPGFYGARRSCLRVSWLRHNTKYILRSHRSVTRGLGIPTSKSELIDSGLWAREAWYLSFPAQVERPLPCRRSTLEQARKPEGWGLRPVSRITKEMRKMQKSVAGEFVALAWSAPRSVNTKEDEKEWKEKVSEGCLKWGFGDRRQTIRRKAKLLGLSSQNAYRYLRPRVSEEEVRAAVRGSRCQVWLPTEWNQFSALGFCKSRESEQ